MLELDIQKMTAIDISWNLGPLRRIRKAFSLLQYVGVTRQKEVRISFRTQKNRQLSKIPTMLTVITSAAKDSEPHHVGRQVLLMCVLSLTAHGA